jgi:hypothetical protein
VLRAAHHPKQAEAQYKGKWQMLGTTLTLEESHRTQTSW